MTIELNDIGKKFNRRWIFKGINEHIVTGDRVAITGRNGAGKSTLLKIIGGFLSPSKGTISRVPATDQPQLKMGFVAPYMHLLEEFSLEENLKFHSRFRKPTLSLEEMMASCGLSDARHELIGGFSSGMQQRVRLCFAFFFEAEVLLLDEPTSNLDENGILWYQECISQIRQDQTLLVASNQAYEYSQCTSTLLINNFTP